MLDRDNYWQILVAYLPRGLAWRRERASVQGQVLDAVAASAERVDNAAAALVVDTFPRTTVDHLPEWEATLGLPDPCVGEQPTLQQRQQQVTARIAAQGGQSVSYYVGVARSIGLTATVREFTPMRVGMRVGQRVYGSEWQHAWRVEVVEPFAITSFRAGRSRVGERLRVWSNNGLDCVIQRIRPAHTIVTVAYPAAT